MAERFEICKDDECNFHFVFRDANGQVVLFGDGSPRKSVCHMHIEWVRTHRDDPTSLKAFCTKTGEYRFNLVMPSGKVVATSAAYASIEARNDAIIAIQRTARTAAVEDMTWSIGMFIRPP